MKKYAWHPKLHAVILRFMIWTAMWKNLYIQYCAQKIAFLLQTSNKKIPYMFNWKRQHGSLVFSFKHKWVNIKVLYKILTSTKYKALSLSFRNWIYKASFFFQNIFIGKGLKTILIIHIWSQFCLKKIVGKCT